MIRALVILALVGVGLPVIVYVGWLVHCTLDRLCAAHARRFCRRNGLEVNRVRWQMAFDRSGVKTEFTLVQLDCLDVQKRRKLILLLVWPFGIRKVLSDEEYPERYDEQWPQTRPPNPSRPGTTQP